MATCKDCIHKCICNGHGYIDADDCSFYADKADFVEVVRCKDCKYCYDAIMGGMWCEHPDNIMPLGSNPCDFCSYGERKDT